MSMMKKLLSRTSYQHSDLNHFLCSRIGSLPVDSADNMGNSSERMLTD